MLRESPPNGIIDILSEEELKIFGRLLHIHPDDIQGTQMSLEEILLSVRKKVFENIELPDNYPSSLIPMRGIFNGCSSNIGIVIDSKETSVDQIKRWVINKLSIYNKIPEDQVSSMLKFSPRTWFDGPISVQIIPQ